MAVPDATSAMLRRLIAALFVLFAMPVFAQPPARIAIIIDDLGNNRMLGLQAVALPGALTYSILPQLPYSERLAHAAHAAGKEVMLHLPMQSVLRVEEVARRGQLSIRDAGSGERVVTPFPLPPKKA